LTDMVSSLRTFWFCSINERKRVCDREREERETRDQNETGGPQVAGKESGSKSQHLAVAQTRNIAIDGDDNSEGVTARERPKVERGWTIKTEWRQKVIGLLRGVCSSIGEAGPQCR